MADNKEESARQSAEEVERAAEELKEAAERAQESSQQLAEASEQASGLVSQLAEVASSGPSEFVFLATIFILAIFVGYYVVWSVTPALHTPLMACFTPPVGKARVYTIALSQGKAKGDFHSLAGTGEGGADLTDGGAMADASSHRTREPVMAVFFNDEEMENVDECGYFYGGPFPVEPFPIDDIGFVEEGPVFFIDGDAVAALMSALQSCGGVGVLALTAMPVGILLMRRQRWHRRTRR